MLRTRQLPSLLSKLLLLCPKFLPNRLSPVIMYSILSSQPLQQPSSFLSINNYNSHWLNVFGEYAFVFLSLNLVSEPPEHFPYLLFQMVNPSSSTANPPFPPLLQMCCLSNLTELTICSGGLQFYPFCVFTMPWAMLWVLVPATLSSCRCKQRSNHHWKRIRSWLSGSYCQEGDVGVWAHVGWTLWSVRASMAPGLLLS